MLVRTPAMRKSANARPALRTAAMNEASLWTITLASSESKLGLVT